MDHQRLRFPDLPPPSRRRLPAALTDRNRLLILSGLVIMGIGDVLPWLRLWLPYRGFFEVSGFERASDAGIILELGLAILALTWSDQAWNSRTALLVAGPAALGVACLILLVIAHGDAIRYIDSLHPSGGYGSILPWFWLTGAGAVVVTAGGSVELWRARGRVSFRVGISRSTIAGVAGGIGGAIVGFVAGAKIAELFASGPVVASSTSALVLLSLALAFVGAWVGAVGAASLARPSRRQ